MPGWTPIATQFAQSLLAPALACPACLLADDKRYGVYRNNVTVGLVRALEANFPCLSALVGEDFFRAMARDFIRKYPPAAPILFEYGEELPSFIERAAALARHPYLADVARFEYLWLQSFHEADALPIRPETFAGKFAAEGENLRLSAHPAARFLSSPYAVHSIATASRSGDSLAGIDPSTAEWCIIARPALAVQANKVSQGEFTLLHELAGGQPLGAAADLALTVTPDLDMNKALSFVLTLGVFTEPC